MFSNFTVCLRPSFEAKQSWPLCPMGRYVNLLNLLFSCFEIRVLCIMYVFPLHHSTVLLYARVVYLVFFFVVFSFEAEKYQNLISRHWIVFIVLWLEETIQLYNRIIGNVLIVWNSCCSVWFHREDKRCVNDSKTSGPSQINGLQ